MAITYRRNLGTGAANVPTFSATLFVTTNTSGYTSCTILVSVSVLANQAVGTPAVTDSQGNTYTLDLYNFYFSNSNQRIGTYIFRATGVAPLGTSDWIRFSGPTFLMIEMQADEFTPMLPVTDGTGVNGDPFGSTAVTSNTITTTIPGDLIYSMIGVAQFTVLTSPTPSVTPGSGWTQGSAGNSAETGGGNYLGLATEYQVQANAGDVQATATLAAPAMWVALSVAYEADTRLQGQAVVVVKATGKLGKPGLVGTATTVVVATGAMTKPAMSGTATVVVVATGGLSNASITLTGQNGLFTRLGLLAGLLNAINAHRGSDVPTRVNNIDLAYTVRDDLTDGIYAAESSYQGQARSLTRTIRQLAQDTVVAMVNDVTPQPDNQLSTALAALIVMMHAKAATVKASTVTASWAADTTNDGNAVLVLSTKDASGLTLENAFQEALTATCTGDAQGGGATGNESLTIVSPADESDELYFDWPAGSGTNTALSLVDESAGGSLLADGGFEAWTFTSNLNTLTSWTKAVGTYGNSITDGTINQGTVTNGFPPYKGGFALRFKGTGLELTVIYQQLPPGTLQPLTQYALNCWIKLPTPSAGVLQIALVASAGGAVTTDAQGVANSVSVGVTSAVNRWLQVSGVFRTPRQMTGTECLIVRLTSPLDSGRNLLIDAVCLTAMTQLYSGGPFASAFAGSLPLIRQDDYTITVSNDHGGVAASLNFQSVVDRFLGMKNFGTILPSASSPTINNNLIL